MCKCRDASELSFSRRLTRNGEAIRFEKDELSILTALHGKEKQENKLHNHDVSNLPAGKPK